MPPVQCNPGQNHVALGAPWVAEVSLLQNDDGIPDIPVGKMYTYRHTHCRLSRTSLNRKVPRSPGGQKGHPIGTRLWSIIGRSLLPFPPFLLFSFLNYFSAEVIVIPISLFSKVVDYFISCSHFSCIALRHSITPPLEYHI